MHQADGRVPPLPAHRVRAHRHGVVHVGLQEALALFPKKKEADADERPLLASIVVAMGRQHPHFAFSQLQELLQAKETSPTQKGVLCRALGTLARDYPREVSGYNAALGPLMFAFMSDDEEMLASSAIRSFPYVTVPNAEQEKRIVEKVTQVVVHAEPEVAETAFASLSTYLLQMPDLLLVPLCAIFLSSLASRSMTGGGDTAASSASTPAAPPPPLPPLAPRREGVLISASQWISTREQAEGVALNASHTPTPTSARR